MEQRLRVSALRCRAKRLGLLALGRCVELGLGKFLGSRMWTFRADVTSFAQVNGSKITLQPSYPNITSNMSLALLDVGTPGIFGPYRDVGGVKSVL
jgi:hypothetical protein